MEHDINGEKLVTVGPIEIVDEKKGTPDTLTVLARTESNNWIAKLFPDFP